MAEFKVMSASKLSMLNGCKRAYKLRYVERIRVPMSIRLAFGTAIHHMLEDFYKKNYKSPDTFVNSWNVYWYLVGSIENDNELSEKYGNFYKGIKKRYGTISVHKEESRRYILGWYKRLGADILTRFYIRHKNKPKPIAIEKRFNIKFDGFKLTGNMDRIDEFKNGLAISDYKTDKKCPSKNDLILRKHHQFTVYRLAFKELYNQEPSGIFMYHLRSGNVMPTKRTDEDIANLKETLEKAKTIIESDDFHPFFGFHCNLCDYLKTCQQREVEGNIEEIVNDEENNLFWGINDDE